MSDKPTADAAKTQPAPEAEGPIKLRLRKPVLRDGEPTNELEFREPTAGDIERCGNPVVLDLSSDPARVTFDERKMTQMMAALAGAPPSSIRAMHPRDWTTAAWMLAGFFTPDLGM